MTIYQLHVIEQINCFMIVKLYFFFQEREFYNGQCIAALHV